MAFGVKSTVRLFFKCETSKMCMISDRSLLLHIIMLNESFDFDHYIMKV